MNSNNFCYCKVRRAITIWDEMEKIKIYNLIVHQKLFPFFRCTNIIFTSCKGTGTFCTKKLCSRILRYIFFDSDLVWPMQLMIFKGQTFVLCVQGIFNLSCLLIEFVIPNLSQIYFYIPEIFKTYVSNQFLSTKSTVNLCFQCCELTKVIVQLKSLCKMFVLKLSGMHKSLPYFGCTNIIFTYCTLYPKQI